MFDKVRQKKGDFKMVYEIKHKTKFQYAWGEGYHPNLDASIVGEIVEQIEDRHGKVTRELFLEASRPENSPTHKLFEWDNDAAAEKYRLSQATQTICNLRVVKVNSEKVEQKVKAFVNVGELRNPKKSGMYVNIVSALNNDKTREIILSRLRTEIQALIERNKNIEELADMLIEAGEQLKGNKE